MKKVLFLIVTLSLLLSACSVKLCVNRPGESGTCLERFAEVELSKQEMLKLFRNP